MSDHSTPRKILVTGATGFIGGHLVAKLCSLGCDVHIITRASSDLSQIKHLGITQHHIDLLDLDSLKSACQGCEAVFHLAGLISYNTMDRDLMESVNVQGTQNILEACEAADVKKLIYISSVAAVGFSKKAKILNEESAYNIGHLNLGYFETKRAAELLVQQKKETVYSVILNPSNVYGPADFKKGSRTFQKKVASGSWPFYTRGGVSITHVDSVIDAIIAGWEKGRRGERYILGGENITIQRQLDLTAEAAGAPKPKYRIPNSILFLLGLAGDAYQKLTKKRSKISSEQTLISTRFHWFDSSKAIQELGYKILPAKDSLSQSVSWAKKNGFLK